MCGYMGRCNIETRQVIYPRQVTRPSFVWPSTRQLIANSTIRISPLLASVQSSFASHVRSEDLMVAASNQTDPIKRQGNFDPCRQHRKQSSRSHESFNCPETVVKRDAALDLIEKARVN